MAAVEVCRGFHSGYNADYDTHDVTDEDLDRLCDFIEADVDAGGVLVDYTSSDYFPERWFDLVVVLRTSNDALWPRLEARGYSELKIRENVQAEIMDVVMNEVAESYEHTPIQALASESVEDMHNNVEALVAWIEQWKPSESA